MSTTKTFPIETVLGLTTGYLLRGSFTDLHELAEWVMGHSIWTHEFAEKELWARLREAACLQNPQLRSAEDVRMPASREDYEAYLAAYCARARAQFGDSLSFTQGTGERSESPIESMERIMPDKPIIALVLEKP